MATEREYIHDLFERYLQNRITDAELEELFFYIQRTDEDDALKKEILSVYAQASNEQPENRNWNVLYKRIVSQSRPKPRKPIFLLRKIAAAVLFLVGASFAIYSLTESRHQVGNEVVQEGGNLNDIQPGGDKAKLVTANGQTYLLDSAGNHQLAQANSRYIARVTNGTLAYKKEDDGKMSPPQVEYNTLTTPRGGFYRLVLSDGTRVWLNSLSSIHFPIVFSREKREVEVEGEVYFEVAEDADRPFVVTKGHTQIRVLGTHFDVNAYENNPQMEVTLLSGLVEISQVGENKRLLIHPEEQAQIDRSGSWKLVKNVETKNVIAWKEGYFSFKNDDLREVMTQLERWYDMEVVFSDQADRHQRFTGSIEKDLSLSQVLTGLMQSNADFEIEEGGKVILFPSSNN